jgi:hypothetical protein
MRIRQVKPAFWTDAKVAKLGYPTRLFYIGLWCIADDAGWLEWDLDELGAMLFPHESPGRRRRHVTTWAEELVRVGRVVLLDCGCAVIPTLDTHQRHAGGNRSFQFRDAHLRRHPSVSTGESVPVPEKGAGTVGNGRVRNGKVGNGSARALDQDPTAGESEFSRKVPRP